MFKVAQIDGISIDWFENKNGMIYQVWKFKMWDDLSRNQLFS